MLKGALAGIWISLGGALATYAGTLFPEHARLLSALIFPIGLLLVIATNAELFTGDILCIKSADEHSKANLCEFLSSIWFANFAGAIVFSFLLCLTLAPSGQNLAFTTALIDIAMAKGSIPILRAFFSGIACNFLVCSAVALNCKTDIATECKYIYIYIPIFAFVLLGFEHSVADMFYIFCGAILGAPLNPLWIWLSLGAVTAGNILGGLIFHTFIESEVTY